MSAIETQFRLLLKTVINVRTKHEEHYKLESQKKEHKTCGAKWSVQVYDTPAYKLENADAAYHKAIQRISRLTQLCEGYINSGMRNTDLVAIAFMDHAKRKYPDFKHEAYMPFLRAAYNKYSRDVADAVTEWKTSVAGSLRNWTLRYGDLEETAYATRYNDLLVAEIVDITTNPPTTTYVN